jgi:3-oxoadipate enol-lactonase
MLMPFMKKGDLDLHYRIEGKENAPVLIMSNSLGTNLGMWIPQMAALLERFRVVRYDQRGHGQSSVPAGPYRMEQFGQDVIALMDHIGIDRAHFCGLSMGGMTGMWVASNHPERIDRLALCNTAAHMAPPDLWNARIDKVGSEGMASIVPSVIERWFTADFRSTAQKQIDLVRAMLLQTPDAGYVASCAAIRDMDQRESIDAIVAPTLVIAGKHDNATTPEDGKLIAGRIKGARYVELNAAHLSNWEVAQAFTTNVVDFLTASSSASSPKE